jgi:hypothetical protein
MSISDRQNRLLLNQDWKRIYQSFRNADFQSYDFDNLRRTMIQYLRENYPENFNDYIETSEYVALIDLIAFLGQNLSFRVDLNARENFLETAERRESVLRLARLISYNPKRNQAANGLLKIEAVKTSESIFDSSGVNMNGITAKWNDPSNNLWLEQFTKIINAALPVTNPVGKPLKSANISGVPTEQYRFNALNTDIPVYKFTRSVQGKSEKFEIVSTDIDNNLISEEPPLPGNNPAFLYRDDGKGAGSSNTGFFMHFRQGDLKIGNFAVSNPTPNQIVSIDTPNINNSDVWLYGLDLNGFETELWTKVDTVEGNNVIYNSLFKKIKNIFAVGSRVDDRINLIFADGVFGNIPGGNYKLYYRTSANRFMNISPAGMANINIEIPYISKANNSETLTITLSLKTNVSNSSPAETNAEIKQNAPATYYTQNRMITAEDYNVGPLAVSQDITKVKSVNRLSSGISRYFDLKDTTGKYSSTNLYANDGILYKEDYNILKKFNFTTQSDIEGFIYNTITPILSSNNIKNFYLSKYNKIIVDDLNASWNSRTNDTNLTTGNLSDTDGDPLAVGTFTANSLRLLEAETMLKFLAPSGYHFMEDNTLMLGDADHPGSKEYIWTKVISITDDGKDLDSTLGPIYLNDNVPQGAVLTEIRPKLAENLLPDVIVQIIDQTFAYNDFGLRYDQFDRQWKIILAENIDTVNEFNLGKAGNTSEQNLDSSWIFYFKTDGETYNVNYRNLRYIFESDSEIKFYFDSADKIYDSKTGKTIKDKINVLNINKKPDELMPFTRDFAWSISDAYRDSSGYIESKKIEVTFFDSDDDGVYDDIELFEEIVSPSTNIANKFIFQEKYITEDKTEDFKYFDNSNNTIIIVSTESNIGSFSVYNDKQVFYIIETNVFKYIDKIKNNTYVTSDYRAYVGREKIKFHYLHTADNDQRIDPALSNIIDTYLLTRDYDVQYRLWLSNELDIKPIPQSSDQLFLNYSGQLNQIKSISDEIIYHPVKYKPLFGDKAIEELQVTFKIVKNPSIVLNDNQLKSTVVDYINKFFASENWDFGDTFYFQELSTYIMSNMSPNIASLLIVPKQDSQVFGSLFEIKSEPDEVFINAATVSDIEVINEISAKKLKVDGKVVSATAQNNTGVQSNVLVSNSSSSSGGYSY